MKGEKVAIPAVTQGTQFVSIGKFSLKHLFAKEASKHMSTLIFISYGDISVKTGSGEGTTAQDFSAVPQSCRGQ